MTAQIHDKVLSQKGINYLLDFLHKKDRYYQEKQFVRKQGFITGANDWPEKLVTNLLKKLNITSNPYSIMMIDLDHQLGIHTDTLLEDRCDKNIIVPLELSEPAATVIFKNKWYGKSMNLDHTNKHTVSIEHDNPFDKNIYEKYLKNFDYSLLNGLEVETIYNWVVGSVCVFDSQHLHTNAYISKYKKAMYIWTIT
jgi:hypothetical protein